MNDESKFDQNPPSNWQMWFAWRIYIRHCNTPEKVKEALTFAKQNGKQVGHGWCPEKSGCYMIQFKDPEYF